MYRSPNAPLLRGEDVPTGDIRTRGASDEDRHDWTRRRTGGYLRASARRTIAVYR
jgi:hypothetical protein